MAVLLRPALLDDLGLMPALQFLVEDFVTRTGLACELIEEGVEEHLPDAAKTCVYRVVQEALHNCEKHSNASNVRVEVTQTDGLLTAAIEDDGRGFVVAKAAHTSRMRLGLMGMRERAAIAHGSLAIDSQPDHGTRVVLRIPVPTATAAAASSITREVHA
jgi:hypothetical protein